MREGAVRHGHSPAWNFVVNAPPAPFSLADAIDAVLPQTQCGKCGYAGCRPYAEAIAAGAADINQCPPAGEEGLSAIAAVLGVPPKALDPRFGSSKTAAVALIEEEKCIGCTLCIQACPVDAIVGAAKLMHTVMTSICTGCELCIPPCPVDCIRMEAVATPGSVARYAAASAARSHFEARNRRVERAREEAALSLAAARVASAENKKKQTIARALERARLRLTNRKS
jgi:electron transport complex protein RnfB